MLEEITNELKNSNNTIINKLFPFSSLKLYQKLTEEELDNLFLKLLKKLNVDYLIECGAHEATASLSFVKSGGKAIAIEANPFVYRDITPKSFDRFTSINMGLSDKEEVLFFFFSKG